ncbi:MAG: AMP-binding protein [Anaerolineales bacterium]|nr:AMP-binding protein [Anaerolineales bacterium]
MTTLNDVLQQDYEESPERVAIYWLSQDIDVPITVHSLVHSAAGFARSLADAGIQAGDPLVIILQHERALAEAFFGCVLHGAIPTILPFLTEKLAPHRYRQSLQALLEITQPTAIISYPDFENEVELAIRESGLPITILLADDVRPANSFRFQDLEGASRDVDEIVLLQHSSGTTGLQKGVALSHRSILNQISHYADAIHMTSQDVVVNWLPLYHDMGLIAGFLMPILRSVPTVLMSPFDWVRAPQRLHHAVSRYGGTITWLPNFAYNFCAKKIRDRDLAGVDLSNWRAVINCSEPMRQKSHEMFMQRFERYGLRRDALATCYAMAENVFAITQGGVDTPSQVDEIDRDVFMEQHLARPARRGEEKLAVLSAGVPIAGTRVRVIDEQYQDLPERSIGEIALKSDCMLTGYFNRDDLTAQAFHEGWFLTGDLGYLVGGELYLTGRKKEILIVGGRNIYPQDLEELVSEVQGIHPGRVVAFGVFSDIAGTEDVGIVAEADTKDSEARRKLEERIRLEVNRGSDIVLRYVRVVPRGWVIKTSSGKLAREANRTKFLEERSSLNTLS